ncbi:MAG: bifunctional 3-(3-hydroxy-phenyl)propionate/3-hydroxycinnamic acid hydroxylase [Actinomycetota bacterium]
MTDVDVAIVGGGPVGVAAGLLLARRGRSVRVFERQVPIHDLPRAVGMDAEIQRVFQGCGLREELAAITTPLAGAEFLSVDGRRIVGHDFSPDDIYPLGHHPGVMFHQPELEALLRDRAVAAGVDLRLGVEVAEVIDHGDAATVDAGDEVTAASWVIAADGAGSEVRKALRIPFVDQGFDQDWLVFDVRLHRPNTTLTRHAQQICDPARPATVIPGHPPYRRWEFQLQPGESAEEMTAPDRVWSLIEPWLTPDDGELQRAVVYRFHATVAGRFRAGRILLAGDAAHQMPPFLGQGLCSGIRDAVDLGWKLDLVLAGTSSERLLDTYDEERRPHAEQMVAHAVDTGRLIDQLAGRGDGVGLEAGYGGGRPFPSLRSGIRFGDHGAVGKPLPQPVEDGRWFDDRLGDGFAVLVGSEGPVDAVALDRWTGLGATVVRIGPGDGPLAALVPPEGAVVVRPDRYVAAVVEDGGAFDRATATLFELAAVV